MYAWRIFKADLAHLVHNVIGIIITIGVMLIPSMYAWFNISASWDPYKNTQDLKVAVVNADEGYKSDLIPVEINAGEKVEVSLRRNTSLTWHFTTRDKAIDGVNAGDYYAAVIIPSNFSARIMTVFSQNAQPAQIDYYVNEKMNALSPRITEKAANTITTQVSHELSKTIAETALEVGRSLSSIANSDGVEQFANASVNRLRSYATMADNSRQQLAAYSSLLDTSQGLITSAQTILDTLQSDVRNTHTLDSLRSTTQSISSLSDATRASINSLSTALSATDTSLQALISNLDRLSSTTSGPIQSLSQRMTSVGTRITASAQGYTSLIQNLTAIKNIVNSDTSLSLTTQSRISSIIDAQIAQLQVVSTTIADVGTTISTTGQEISQTQSLIATEKADIRAQLDSSRANLQQVKASYDSDVKPYLLKASQSLSSLVEQARDVYTHVQSAHKGLTDVTTQASQTISHISQGLNSLGQSLGSLSTSLTQIADAIEAAYSGDNANATLQSILGDSNGTTLNALNFAIRLSTPVTLTRTAVYPIANYGSQMAAFYSTLSIWVGCVVLVSVVGVRVSDKQKARLLGVSEEEFVSRLPKKSQPEMWGNARTYGLGAVSEYFGRYLVFMVLSLAQTTIIALGDLYFLRIQHTNAWLFMLISWLTSIVFSSIMYALTVAFGAAGKAIAVVLMVMQVAGSGGTFPVQLLPPFFQHVYPLLPFPYAITAMHETIGGSYGHTYLTTSATLLIFFAIAVFIGLFVRIPLMKSVAWIEHQLESTHVFE